MAEGGDHGVLRLRATWWRRCLGDSSAIMLLYLIGLGVAGAVSGLVSDASLWWPAASALGVVLPGAAGLLLLLQSEVVLDPHGVALVSWLRRRELPWHEIEAIELVADRSGTGPVARLTSVRLPDAPLYVVHRGGMRLSPLVAIGRDYRHELVAPLLAAAQLHGCRVRVARFASRSWDLLVEA